MENETNVEESVVERDNIKEESAKVGGKQPKGVKIGRFFFSLFALIFMACVIVQIFLAGMAVFVNVGDWSPHTSFIHDFELVPVVMFILSFVGNVPNRIRWGSFGLIIMIILQYITAKAFSGAWLAALHPVIAVFIFWSAVTIVRKTLRWIIGRE